MGRGSTGAKAGAVAGIVYGILIAIFGIIILTVEKTQIISALNSYIAGLKVSGAIQLDAQSLYNLALTVLPVTSLIEGIIGGLILGAIFGLAVHRIPGSNDKVKGIVFGLILWLLFTVLLGLSSRAEYGNDYYLLSVVTGLISVVVYGYLLGALFGKWWVEPSSHKEKESFQINL